jgi:dihydrofolate reductase
VDAFVQLDEEATKPPRLVCTSRPSKALVCSLVCQPDDSGGASDQLGDRSVRGCPITGVRRVRRHLAGAEKIVYSSTLPAVSTRRTRLERKFEAAAVDEIKKHSATDLYVDGPTLAAHAMRLGVVDRLYLIVCPVIVGVGLAMLPDGVRLNLRLDAEHRYSNGMIGLQYDIVH